MKTRTRFGVSLEYWILSLFLSVLALCCGCSSSNFISYKSKKYIKEEFPERFFLDSIVNVGFEKTYGFRYIDKKSLSGLRKTIFYKQISAFKEDLIPVYVATRSSVERLTEYIMVFKIKGDLSISDYLSKYFQQVDLYKRMGNYKQNSIRFIQTYYARDALNNWMVSAALVRPMTNETSFLIASFLPYNNDSTIVNEFITSNSNNLPKGGGIYSGTYNYGVNRYGLDTILQNRGFWNIARIINSVKKADQFVYHDYFEIANKEFVKYSPPSYYEPVKGLKNWDKNELEASDDGFSYNYYKRSLSTYLSFLGSHKEAIEDTSIKRISRPDGYSVMPADKYVLDQIGDKRIIVFNEFSIDVRNRVFLFHLLDSLKKRGFTHLAIEDLNRNFRIGQIDGESGFYIREPVFHNLVEYANSIGLKVLGYNFCKDCLFSTGNKAAAKHLLNRINLKKHKLIVLCAMGNLGKSKKTRTPNTLVDYLQYYSRQEPFTVAQAIERWFYLADTVVNNYYVLRSGINGSSYHPTNSSANVSVFAPNSIKYFDYDFYYNNGLLPVNKFTFQYVPTDSVNIKDVVVYLYKNKRKNKTSLPLFVKHIKNNSQALNVYSCYKEAAHLEVRDEANNLLYSKEMEPELNQ